MAVHHVALSVTDLARSERWYTEVFALEVRFREEADTRRAVILGFTDGPLQLGLVQHSENDRTPFTPVTAGLDHVAFTVASRAELDARLARLDELGVSHSGAIEIPAGAIANFQDPDGIQLAFFWEQ